MDADVEADRSDYVEGAARTGLAAKGVLYVVVGLLAGQLGLGRDAPDASQQGALSTLASQPFGAVLLGLAALGFAAYALWRGWQTFAGIDGDSSLPKPLLRATFAVRAALYGLLAMLAVRQLAGVKSGGEASMTAAVLAVPGGVALVVAIGCVVVVVGLAQWREALTTDFLKELDTARMSVLERRMVRGLGVAGHASRGTVFALAGGFLVRAAFTGDASEVGLDGSLQQVAGAPYGSAAIVLVGAGLVIYGLFCFVQSWVARIYCVD